MPNGRNQLGLVVLSVLLAACGRATSPPVAMNTSLCVDIPNGQYFQFVDGRLVNATERQIRNQEQPPETARRIGGTLAAMGYPWVSLEWDGQVVIISGLALNENTRSDAFIAAKSVFEADSVAGPLVQRVVNAMEVRDPTEAIALRLTDELKEDDLSWLRVVMAGKVATLVGRAPSESAKSIGYQIGRSTVESDLDASQIVNIVVDAIALPGNDEPVGAALVELGPEASRLDCQIAFDQVMTDRAVAFEPGEAIVMSNKSRLLDAVTGVALLCQGFEIEIAGQTASQGDVADRLDLAQRRASAVRDYLMAYGVEPEILTARGYASAAPQGSATDSGRQTAFIVRERRD
jgi:outer membrane protein OmpA-like peptidoglycan-associated protein